MSSSYFAFCGFFKFGFVCVKLRVVFVANRQSVVSNCGKGVAGHNAIVPGVLVSGNSPNVS